MNSEPQASDPGNIDEHIIDAGTHPAWVEEQAGGTSSPNKDARRAFRAAIIGLMVLPLGVVLQYTFGQSDYFIRDLSGGLFILLGIVSQGYASKLLLKVYRGKQDLRPRSVRTARVAACLNVSFYLTVLAMAGSLFLPRPRPREEDLRQLAHPPEMVGSWQFNAVDGEPVMELVLKKNGDLRYRVLVDPKVDFSGSWGLGGWMFYFRCEHLLAGEWQWNDQIFGYDFDGFTEDEIIFRHPEGPMRFVRKLK